MLTGYGNRSGDRNRQRTAGANRAIKDAVNPPQNRPPESGQAVLENFMHGMALIDAPHAHRFSLRGMHLYECRIEAR